MARDRRTQKRVILYRATIPGSTEIWEVEYTAVADALHFACRDLREGRRQPIEILEDGAVVHDAAAIARECHEMTRELAEESGLPIDDDF
jgi:hypothetical protein